MQIFSVMLCAAALGGADPEPEPTPPPVTPAPSPARTALETSGKLLVLESGEAATGTADGAAPSFIATEVAAEIAKHSPATVLTGDDVTRLFEHEAGLQLFGCTDSSACLARLADLAHCQLILGVSTGHVGSRTVVSLSLLDAKSGGALGRVSGTAEGPEALRGLVAGLLTELFAWAGEAEARRFSMPGTGTVTFAVFNLESTGVSEDVAKSLTPLLATAIKEIDRTKVISSDDIVAMLRLESKREQLGCVDDPACIAELGGALGVEKLIVGSVGKLSESYVISLRLIDTMKASVDNRVSESFRGSEDNLIQAVRLTGRRLLGVDSQGVGRLAVAANEQEASVFLDETPRGVLPLPPLSAIEPGRHTVRLVKPGFYDWQSDVYVEPNATTALFGQLSAQPDPWYRKWWLWAGAGVVAAGAFGLYYYTASRVPSTDLGTWSLK